MRRKIFIVLSLLSTIVGIVLLFELYDSVLSIFSVPLITLGGSVFTVEFWKMYE